MAVGDHSPRRATWSVFPEVIIMRETEQQAKRQKREEASMPMGVTVLFPWCVPLVSCSDHLQGRRRSRPRGYAPGVTALYDYIARRPPGFKRSGPLSCDEDFCNPSCTRLAASASSQRPEFA